MVTKYIRGTYADDIVSIAQNEYRKAFDVFNNTGKLYSVRK